MAAQTSRSSSPSANARSAPPRPAPPRPFHQLVLALALGADCAVRTSAKALREGVDEIRGAGLRARLRATADELGVSLPLHSNPPPSAA